MIGDDDIPLETEDEIRQRIRGGGGGKDARGADSPPAARRLPLIVVAVVLLLGAVEVGATIVQHLAVPAAADWRAAAARLATTRRPDEPVLFAPLWVEPIGRSHVRDIDLELLLLSDVDRYRRVFEVSTRGARHPWLAGEKPASTWHFGGVRLSLFERQEPARVLFDFTRKIREAQVSRIGAQVARCPWDGQRRRFRCDPARGWNSVGPHLAEVGHRPYRCIFAHPVEGHVMRISFPAADIGSSLVGYTGIDDFENRKRADAEVLLKVLVGPRQVGAIRHQNGWPWHRFTLDTKEMAGQTHPVSFEITADRAFARTFCFAAESRR